MFAYSMSPWPYVEKTQSDYVPGMPSWSREPIKFGKTETLDSDSGVGVNKKDQSRSQESELKIL